jgi:hypothetical protein
MNPESSADNLLGQCVQLFWPAHVRRDMQFSVRLQKRAFWLEFAEASVGLGVWVEDSALCGLCVLCVL